jgi:hypothetical protein
MIDLVESTYPKYPISLALVILQITKVSKLARQQHQVEEKTYL